MPALFVFLLKVNIALLLFCAGYYLVLRHLTFYTLNRIYLLAAILFASVYPQINLSDFVQQHQQLTRPVQAVAINWQTPAQVFIKPLAQPDYWYWVEIIFWSGVVLLALRLLTQIYSLYRLYRNSEPATIYNHNVRVIKDNAAPFSFWKSIYVNPESHEPADLKAILLHEQVHVNEWHTLDILLAELSTIFYWFNPGIWLMKKAIRENIEFITDRKILKKGIDTKQYQYSLVNVSFAVRPQGLVNHFNVSTIKKRIIMMNAKRSSRITLTRYAFLMPVVVLLLLVFSISKAAFIKKSAKSHKVAVLNIPKISPLDDMQVEAGTAHAPFHNTKNAAKTVSAVNITVTKPGVKMPDTLKNGGVFISTDEKTDSLNYIINGVKAKKSDFKALDPDKIYSIEILTGEQGSKIVDNIDRKHSVLFVTTDDSETGKKFKEKIDNLNENRFMVAGKMASRQKFKSFSKRDPVAIAYGNGDSYSIGDTGARVRVYGYPRKTARSMNGAYVLGSGAASGDPIYIRTDSAEGYALGRVGKDSVRFMSPRYKTLNRKLAAMSYYRGNAYKYSPLLARTNVNSETNISHLSTKLIMIDGKEVTEKELKKLSAADIDSMSAQSGEEITKKYGDKAKNGVLFITTKKKAK